MTMTVPGSGSGWFGRRRVPRYGLPRVDAFNESMASRLSSSTFEVSGQLTWLDDGRGQRAVADQVSWRVNTFAAMCSESSAPLL